MFGVVCLLIEEVKDERGCYSQRSANTYWSLPIFAFKGCPETKAILEGESSNLERELGTVRIEGRDKRELAKGVLKVMVDLYVTLRNQKPRCSVCHRSPLNLMEEEPGQEELRHAKEGLQERQKWSLAPRQDSPIKPEKHSPVLSRISSPGIDFT